MKSILFVEKRLRIDKIGFLYLSAIMKNAGHKVDMIQDDIESVDNYLNENDIDFIMYSVVSGEHPWFLQKNRDLKEHHKFTSVMGGPHFTFFPEQGLEDPSVDYVVRGPGENVILDIIDGIYKNKFVVGSMPDVNALPHPDREPLYKYDEFGKAPMKRFIACRYCLYSCKYCFNHSYKKLYKGQKHMFTRRVAPEKMVDEILEIKNKYGLETVYFNDDDFTGDVYWLEEFCKLYKEKIHLPFCGSMRANSATRELIELMADAGCAFMNLAIESANPSTQKLIRRGFITNAQVEQACADCADVGIKVRLQNMIGLPVDDPMQDALDTLEFNIKVNPTDSWASIFQPFPGTEMWQYCLDKKLITTDTQSVNFYDNTQLDIENPEKINRLHKWWFFIVKHQLPMELVKILIDLPLTKEQRDQMQNFRWNIAKELLYGM